LVAPAWAATYYVDNQAPNASDQNPGTEQQPWQHIARAAAASELKPGDTVLIKAGVYREHVDIKVSGQPGKPITFAAAPGARVVIKGSELVTGRWTKLKDEPAVQEPYPNAFERIWKIQLEDRFFTDPRFSASYQDKARRWVSQVFLEDWRALQRIGPDPIYQNEPYLKLTTIGRGLSDMTEDSFYFDPADQTLYLKISGEPAWYSIEVGVRGFVLTAEGVHDVVIRGLEMRQNRQPGGQWPMVAIARCARVVVEDCRIYQADFCGLGLGACKHCVVRNCDLSYNGNSGLGMGDCEDCLIEDCRLLFNNYRRFFAGWHCGGMKCIPNNRRCTVQRCEAAYNIASDGIWFDSGNADIRILDNVCHHNDGCGIFFEINKGGGIIANNLVYANRGRGIYISGSQNTWIVHNTVASNDGGIVCMPREADWTLENIFIYNNLLINNYVTANNLTRGCDLTLFMGAGGEEGNPGPRRVMTVHSDYNVYANNSWTPLLRHSWNPNNTLAQWRERFGEDLHSRLMPVAYELRGTAFRLLSTEGLDLGRPLPAELGWKAPQGRRVGCARTQWP
jgi:parallel beta-helix repeat protein